MKIYNSESCAKSRRAMHETLEIINGKWKLIILTTLENRPYRFTELAKEIGRTPRMLSKELHDMEINQLISRTVLHTKPVSVEYAITKYGLTFGEVMEAMQNLGGQSIEIKLFTMLNCHRADKIPLNDSNFNFRDHSMLNICRRVSMY